jgi:hypothetical protein
MLEKFQKHYPSTINKVIVVKNDLLAFNVQTRAASKKKKGKSRSLLPQGSSSGLHPCKRVS